MASSRSRPTTRAWRLRAGPASTAPSIRPDERVRPDRLVLALEAQVDRVAEPEQRPCRLEGPVADEHRPRFGLRLEARGNVDRVARDHRAVGMDLRRRQDLTGVDADPDGEPDAVLALEVGGEVPRIARRSRPRR